MLRASIETEGAEVDYRGIADAASAEESTLPGAGALVGFVEASLSTDREAAIVARERVRRELGDEALVDAAAVIGNFERMTRIADATGIPLDAPVSVMTESIRAELGIDEFGRADDRAPLKGWQRWLGRMLDPAFRIGMRWLGRRERAKSAPSSSKPTV